MEPGSVLLRPIAEDCTDSRLVLEFRLLGKEENRLVNYEKTDASLADKRDGYNPKAILSGDILTVSTKDPRNYPLPYFQLLDLQYHLNRALRATGAGEVLRLLFRRDQDRDPGDKSDTPVDLWEYPLPTEESAFLAAYLVEMAVEEGIIEKDEVDLWLERYNFQKISLNDEVS